MSYTLKVLRRRLNIFPLLSEYLAGQVCLSLRFEQYTLVLNQRLHVNMLITFSLHILNHYLASRKRQQNSSNVRHEIHMPTPFFLSKLKT